MMEKNRELGELAKILKNTDKVAITPHKNPDGDCYSSMFSLNIALNSVGIDSNVYLDEDILSSYLFLNQFINFKPKKELISSELIIIVDTSSLDRAVYGEEIKKFKENGSKVMVIDHHRGGMHKDFSDYYYVDTKASATSEIIYELINELNVKIDKNIATCLLAGIESDTASFVNQNTTPKTFCVASDLVSKGARINTIISNTFNTNSHEKLKLWGKAMDNLVYNSKYKTATTYLSYKDIKSCGLDPDDASGIANILNTMKDVNILIVAIEQSPGEIKVSMRTRNNNIDLSKFAQKLGGGGHPGAAGFTVSGSFNDVENNITIK